MPLVALHSAAELRRGLVPDALGTHDLETVAQTVVRPTANDTNDWLTKLIRANAIVKRKPEDALRVFEPFLEAAAAMGGFSMPMATASALFKSLSATADAVKISGKVRVKVEDMEYFLSGNLEQISDDCLKHVLTFVGDSDRVLKVELCCRRLFELSRCTPLGETMCDLGIGNAPLGAKRFSTAAQLTRVFTRFRLTKVNVVYKTLSTAYVIDALKAAQPTLVSLVLSSRSLDIASTMHFPNLQEIHFEHNADGVNDDNVWSNLNLLLNAHSSVMELNYECSQLVDTSDALFALLENCKHICVVNLNVDWDGFGFKQTHARRWNLSHVRDVSVCNCGSIGPVFKPLFHDELQFLELIGCNVDTDIILPPEMELCTQLYDATPKFLRNLWVDGTLEELTVHCTAKFLPAVVQLCTAVRCLTFQLVASEDFGLADGDFINDDTVFADAYAAQSKTAERIEQLIVSCVDTYHRDIDSEEVIAVLEFLSGNEDLAATTTLCVETEQWCDIQLRCGALVDKLHSSVSVICSHS